MKMKEEFKPIHTEPRWPVLLAILVLVLVLSLMSGRVRLMPVWFPYFIAFILMLPMVGVWLSHGHSRWRMIERITTLIFFVTAEVVTLATLMYMMVEMLERPADFSGRQLLSSSISTWFANVLVFSVVYWQLDRGGPEERMNDNARRPDWLFPQTEVPDLAPPNWRPKYIEYLFLSFSTATAFSTTDVIPLTSRAKLLMMLESTVSLATMVVVASRAINLIG